MSAANLMSVREDAQAIQDYVADLKNWEKDIKVEDKRLLALQKEKKSTDVKDPAPIRGRLTPADSKDNTSQKKNAPLITEVKDGKKRIQSNDYAAWDKYDADAAVNTIEKQTSKLACGNAHIKETSPNKTPSSTKATDEDKLKAIKFKDEGNRLYGKGQYLASVTQYSQGLALDPSNHILYANRAMAYIKLDSPRDAVHDCDACLLLSPNYLKAWLRRGAARLTLGQLQHALEDYQKVLEVEPWNKDAKDKAGEIKKRMSSSSPPSNSDAKKQNPKSRNKSITTKVSCKQDKEQKTTENSARRDEMASRLGKDVVTATSPQESEDQKLLPLSTDPDVLQPANKPLHLRSQKPLRKLLVVDVASESDIPPYKHTKKSDVGSEADVVRTNGVLVECSTSNGGTKEPQKQISDRTAAPQSPASPTPASSSQPKTLPSTSPKSSSAAPQQAVSPQSTAVDTPSLPPSPRTSHQFMSSWTKVASHPLVAYTWLQTIKPSSIRGFELEADCISSLAATFTDLLRLDRQPYTAAPTFSSMAAAMVVGKPISVPQMVLTYLEAVTQSRAFELNALFLTSQDKESMLSLLSDLESDSDGLPPHLSATCQLLTE